MHTVRGDGGTTVLVLDYDEVYTVQRMLHEYFNLQGERIADLLEMGHELEAKRREKQCFKVGNVFCELIPDADYGAGAEGTGLPVRVHRRAARPGCSVCG